MIVRCSVCKVIIREKEPYGDKRISDSYCDVCLKIAMEEIENLKENNHVLITANGKR